MEINKHPMWKHVNPIKKPFHLFRISMAKRYAKMIPTSKVIGVVGSVGKTSTMIACEKVLKLKYKTDATTNTSKKTVNLDPMFNIPMTLLRVRPQTEKVLLELGIEYLGEMDFYLSLIKPNVIVVSRLSFEHSEFLGGVESVISESAKSVAGLPKDGAAILNWDDTNSRKLAPKTEAEVIYYGTDPKNCHVWASNLRVENFKVVFELNYGVERVEVRTQLVGFHQIYPLLAAAALGLREEISLMKIKKALESVEAPEHRLQIIPGYNDAIILDDTYNSSPAAVEEALESLNRIPARRRVVVLGEMRELGPFSEKLHRQIAHKLYADKVDLVLLGKGETKYIADELLKLGFIPERMESNLQNPQLVSKLLKLIKKGDVVLIKGSRGVRLDEVVEKVRKRN